MTGERDPRQAAAHQAEIAAEQAYVDGLFDRLDDAVARANESLARVQADVDPQTPDADALVRRETEYHGLQAKLDKLNLAQLGLVFGRIDIDADGDNPTEAGLDRRYIGRMGMDDRADDYRTLLLDWRAPMARPFYLATTAHPEGVEQRRTIRMRGREVTDLTDEFLSGDGAGTDTAGVASESALFQALQQARTGHMSSIVETIQREQDEIIRDSTRGVLVVEGGPGTGKTAVALHRVAYLLYTYRERLASTGVLIVGPNPTFLDYISQVLPELGETGTVLSTIGDLFPGVTGNHPEDLLAREIKGSEAMAEILANAVKDYQQVPGEAQEITVEQLPLEVTPAMVKAARTRARRSRKPHNDARLAFAEHLTESLAQALSERIGADPLGGENLLSRADVDQLHDDLSESPAVRELIDAYWPELSPQQVLSELLCSREFIARAAAAYDEETQGALYRADGTAWTASDAALLDELAVLIGMPDPAAVEEAEREAWKQQVAEAEDALDILSSSESTDNDDDMFDAEILSAHDVIDAETLARRQQVQDHRTTAERARADHTWAFGHVVVDEAQELSAMEWRMVFRRSPSRWVTLVGDTAQTSAPAGVDAWADTLEPFVGGRFRHHRLTVNYRTPEPIAEVANRLLTLIDPHAEPATAIRPGEPVAYHCLPEEEADRPAAGIGSTADGRLRAVIDASNVEEIKGLEFDHVVIVDPQAIVAASPQGLQNLYVALTRATQTLTVYGELPA
ncbi:HelD family protein [Corynebacterium sp. 32222D000AT]|uniref:HelD family protein n=1 Tax=unclassified Corynebacterium TaxID=2624378 RepID=UPI002A97011F|nr:AAA family ATPase [Mycobacteriaceae bacterium]MDY5830175.1 AAA family ATPase [Corynebacterium sp.]